MFAKIVDKITYIYLILPLSIFLINWLNPVAAGITLISLIIILNKIFKGLLKRNFEIKNFQIMLLIMIALLWCILAGIGGLYYQSPDWHMRNAIFRDLVNFSHPVIYDNGSALVYYFGLFLPSAVVGKIALFLHATPEIAFNIANFFNLLYSAFGISLVFLQILMITNTKNKNLFIVLFLFIFFSGLDVLYGSKNDFNLLHIEVHHGFLEYSSNTTLLFWVYNQTIASWLITALFLRKPYNISNYGFWGALGLFYAPLPFIGLSIYFFGMTIYRFIVLFIKKHLTAFFKKLFDVRNVLSVLVLLPIFYLFYKSNITAKEDSITVLKLPLMAVKFVILEVGIYLICLLDKNIKNPVYYVTLISLFLCPFIFIGNNPDFCMRASIPALFILFILIVKYLNDNKSNKILKSLILMSLILGMVTPIVEFYRGFYWFFINGEKTLLIDNIKTLNNKIEKQSLRTEIITGEYLKNFGNYKNYGAVDIENQIFFKYLAKKKK